MNESEDKILIDQKVFANSRPMSVDSILTSDIGKTVYVVMGENGHYRPVRNVGPFYLVKGTIKGVRSFEYHNIVSVELSTGETINLAPDSRPMIYDEETARSLTSNTDASPADKVEQYIRDLAKKNPDYWLEDLDSNNEAGDAAMNGADFDELGDIYAEIAVYNVLGAAGGNNYQDYENALSRAKKVILQLNDEMM